MGESSRLLGAKEHISTRSPHTTVGENRVNEGHNIMVNDATVLAREENIWRRQISEAIQIRERCTAINRDGGHNLPAIVLEQLSYDGHQRGHMTPEGNLV